MNFGLKINLLEKELFFEKLFIFYRNSEKKILLRNGEELLDHKNGI
jgi:hypothetical protein